MKRENLAFLLAGLAFGVLLGFGVFHAVANRPEEQASALSAETGRDAPSGPPAPTQVAGGAPMLQEINALKRALEADPKSLLALARLANLYHDAGMWPQAAGYYERAVEVKPDDPDLLTDLGTCYRELRQFEKALGLFLRAQQVEPSHWQSLYNVVVVEAFDLGRVEEAVAALERLEQVHPQAPHLAELRQAVERVAADRRGRG